MSYDDTMALQGSTTELAKDSTVKVAEQLNRILASKAFRQADHLKRFLTFIVEETIAGRGERLKELWSGLRCSPNQNHSTPGTTPSCASRQDAYGLNWHATIGKKARMANC